MHKIMLTTALCLFALGARAAPVPQIIQAVASSTNPIGIGIRGNSFKIPLPNPVQSGDALVLAISYPDGFTPSIKDNLGTSGRSQAWPAACVKTINSAQVESEIYVLPHTANGERTKTPTLTVSFISSIQPFQYDLLEISNIASSSPCNGVKSLSGESAIHGVIDPGGFRPETNTDGNLIFTYVTCGLLGCQRNVTSFSAATGFTLLEADIAWLGGSTFPHAAQWHLQSTPGTVDPRMTVAGDTADQFNSLTVALKVAAGGGKIPAGIHINKILHQTTDAYNGTTWEVQNPTTGNLRVWTTTVPPSELHITSITSNDTCNGNNSFTLESAAGGNSSQIWWQQDCPANPNLKLTVRFASTPSGLNTSPRFFDIQGAAASAFDAAAGNFAATSGSSVTDQPTIKPRTAGELVIATAALGTGPGLAVRSPTGAVFDLTTFAGETDFDEMENADLLGHLYNAPASALNWTWTITSNGTEIYSEAAAFK